MNQDIPIEELYSHPIVQQLLDKLKKENNNKDDLENIKIPYIIKDKTLMSPGVWNNYFYSSEEINKAFLGTPWDNKEIRSLFLDHADKSSREWIGEIQNPRLQGDTLIGDLVVVDKPTAQKLAYGAKMGISPKVHGSEDNSKMIDFRFDNFSVVINPAVKTAYINNALIDEVGTQLNINKPEEVTKMADKEQQKMADQAKEKPAIDEMSELMETLGTIEVKNASVGEIAKKAKEIRKEGEKWSDAIQRAAKMMSEAALAAVADEEIKKKKCEEEELAKKKEYPYPEEQMAEQDMVKQILKLADLLKKKYPAPEEKMAAKTPEEIKAEEDKAAAENKKLEEMGNTIATLSEKLQSVEKKLNEPADRATLKTAELSAMDTEKLVSADPDSAFLSILQRMGGL